MDISLVNRRVLFVSGFASLIALVLLRYLASPVVFDTQEKPTLESASNELLDNLMVALISGIAVSSFIAYIDPPQKRSQRIIQSIEPRDLKRVLSESLDQTSDFLYSGHTARWTRAETIPRLAEEARLNGTSKTVKVIILDPDSASTCNYFAEFEKRVRPDSDLVAKDYRLELLTTVLSLYVWKRKEPLLDIEIALSQTISLFRLDIYSDSAIVTSPDNKQPALRYDKGTYFYNAYREEVRIRLQQSRHLSKSVQVKSLELNEIERARKFFSDLELSLENLADNDVRDIIRMSNKQNKPY